MKLAVNLPVVVQQPGIASAWEAQGTIADLAAIAATAERYGYDHITCSEHVGVPDDAAGTRGATYWDPLATFGYLAAGTETIRLATNILVLGYHHPLAVAKRYGTLDRVSGGRLVLGVGVGSLEDEFELLGASFADRGARADEHLAALAVAFGQPNPNFSGQFYDFAGMTIEPHSIQAPPPLWIGGRTRRSLRRAVTLGHGWCPFGLRPAELAEMLGSFDLPDGFDAVFGTAPLAPDRDPERARQAVEELVEAGGTIVRVTLQANDASHYQHQLQALAELMRLETP